MTNFENRTETLREERRGVKANRRRVGRQRETKPSRGRQTLKDKNVPFRHYGR